MRYLGDDDTGENLTPAELADLHAQGVKVALVFQTGKSFVLTRPGDECARVALWQATALGFPADRPVYFSLDRDPNPLTPGQWSIVEQFFLDAVSVLTVARVGVYGGRRALDLVDGVHASWGWQTYAWSGTPPVWHPHANVLQYLNGQPMCDGLVDYDVSVTPDFGQW